MTEWPNRKGTIWTADNSVFVVILLRHLTIIIFDIVCIPLNILDKSTCFREATINGYNFSIDQ